ncbi:MAG: hypothetical protein ACNA8H_08000 [Anaerolineales bacterium]
MTLFSLLVVFSTPVIAEGFVRGVVVKVVGEGITLTERQMVRGAR